jgi:deazaflavin-dependent oxidoreductase (nitroreductase family)
MARDPMRDSHVKRLSALHKSVYRATRGHIGRRLVDNDMMLLTTTGRTTGVTHTVPLLYLVDDDDLVVIASYGGREEHPEWYRNLVVTPLVSAQILGETIALDARTMSQRERHAWWPRIVAAYADYEVYQSRTNREIPVVRLSPV